MDSSCQTYYRSNRRYIGGSIQRCAQFNRSGAGLDSFTMMTLTEKSQLTVDYADGMEKREDSVLCGVAR